MIRRYCDKCKADITDCNGFDLDYIKISSIRYNGDKSIHLCEKCYKVFNEWLEKKVTSD